MTTTTANNKNALENLSFSRNGDRNLPSARQLLQHLVDTQKVSVEEVQSSYQFLVERAVAQLNEDETSENDTLTQHVVVNVTGSGSFASPSAPATSSANATTTGDPLNNPARTFCFLVGCKSDWEGKERDEIGDRALFEKLQTQAGIPVAQCDYLADSEATAGACQRRLKKILEFTTAEDTFIFYYGGHGHWKGFNTGEKRWKHVHVIETIEKYFRGHTVLLLVDCCNAANLIEVLKKRKLRCNYICLATSPPFKESGPNYTLTACLVDALDGSPKIPRTKTDVSLSDLVAFMADRHAFDKGDLLCSYVSEHVDPTTPFFTTGARRHRGSSFARNLSVTQDAPSYSRVPSQPDIGARVFYRHAGGPINTVQGESVYFYPSWFEGRVVENNVDGSCRIKAMNPLYKDISWEVTVAPANLLNDLHMGLFCDVSEDFMNANVELAQQFKYLDFGAFRAGTRVRALWWDGILHPGVVLDYMQVDWEGFLEDEAARGFPAAGPHVPVRWVLEGDAWDMVPVSRIMAEPEKEGHQDVAAMVRYIEATSEQALARAAEELTSERQVLIKSIESAGKRIVDAKKIFGATKLKYFWPTDDRDWNQGHAVCPEDVDLFELARHANYDVLGDYCALHCPKFWCKDHTTTVYPVKYIARPDDPKATNP